MGGGNLASNNKKKGFAISGILYPLLILTLFLVVQMLFMLQNRKNVLDKAKTELADTINSSNRVYTNEELSILIEEQKRKNEELNNLINSINNNIYTKEDVDKKVEGSVKEYSKIIDLRGSEYNPNLWYPVVSADTSSIRGYRRLRCRSGFGWSGTPFWATHSSGFTSSVDLFSQIGDWGGYPARTVVLASDYKFASAHPVGYYNYNEPGKHIFYLRGGGSYQITTDFQPNWIIYTSKHIFSKLTLIFMLNQFHLIQELGQLMVLLQLNNIQFKSKVILF